MRAPALSNTMRIGFGAIPDGPADSAVNLVQLGEALGYDAAWMPDQTFHRDPFVLLARIAAATTDIQLILGITSPITRNPVQVARSIATLAELAPGRIVLGYGVGNQRQLIGPLGLSSRDAPARVAEAVRVTRRLLNGERVTFAGKHFQMRDVELSIPKSAPVPVYIAARGPQMLAVAGAEADGVIVGSLVSDRAIAYAKTHIERGAVASGRDPNDVRLISWCSAFIAAGPASPDTELHPMVAHVVAGAPSVVLDELGIPAEDVERIRGAFKIGDEAGASRLVTSTMVDTFAFAGDTAQLRHGLRRIEKAGFSEIGLLLQQRTHRARAEFLESFADAFIRPGKSGR